MTRAQFDIIAIGGGTAGLVTAAGGAGLGAKVALIERDRLGGECLWNGCVPSKALIAAARSASSARNARRFGVETGHNSTHLNEAMDWVRAVQTRIAPNDSPERFRGLGVHVLEASARFVDQHSVEANGQRLTARKIVIATGTRPVLPPIPGLAGVKYHTNETIFGIDALPKRLIVIGGGPIGCELAQAFARLGSSVRVIEATPTFFPREDGEVASLLQRFLEEDGVVFHLGAQATRVRREGAAIAVTVSEASGETADLQCDALLVAVGRAPNVEALGADVIGLAVDRGGVVTDAKLQTNVPNVFAAGDIVSGGLKFTHVADFMARGVLRNALFPGAKALDYSAVPWVTYTDPELARVGLTEVVARERHGSGVAVWRRSLDHVDRVIADGSAPGLVKIVTDQRGRVLGGHILAAHAGEMIGELTMAVKLRLTVGQLGNVIHPYPTAAEAIRQAAEQRVKTGFVGWKQSLVRRIVRRV